MTCRDTLRDRTPDGWGECKHATEEDHLIAMLHGTTLKRAIAWRKERDAEVAAGRLIQVTAHGYALVGGKKIEWISGDYVERALYERRQQ